MRLCNAGWVLVTGQHWNNPPVAVRHKWQIDIFPLQPKQLWTHVLFMSELRPRPYTVGFLDLTARGTANCD